MVCRGISLHTAVYRVQRTIKLHRLVWGGSLGRWGSLSVDGSDTHSQRQGEAVQQGASWRLRYSNQLTATGTNFFSDEMAVCLAGL